MISATRNSSSRHSPRPDSNPLRRMTRMTTAAAAGPTISRRDGVRTHVPILVGEHDPYSSAFDARSFLAQRWGPPPHLAPGMPSRPCGRGDGTKYMRDLYPIHQLMSILSTTRCPAKGSCLLCLSTRLAFRTTVCRVAQSVNTLPAITRTAQRCGSLPQHLRLHSKRGILWVAGVLLGRLKGKNFESVTIACPNVRSVLTPCASS